MKKFYTSVLKSTVVTLTIISGYSHAKNMQNSYTPSSYTYHVSRMKFSSINASVFYILNKKTSFLSHEILATPQYTFFPTSFLPQNIQRFTGHIGVYGGLSWTYQLKPFKFFSYYPLSALAGVRWEAAYIPYITPFLQASIVYLNPFQQKSMPHFSASTTTEKLYMFSVGALLSFNVFDPNFSLKMKQEYDITDMGLLAEYQTYNQEPDPFSKNVQSKGFSFGFYISF